MASLPWPFVFGESPVKPDGPQQAISPAPETSPKTQLLPKDLLTDARKLEGDEITKAIAGEIAKSRKRHQSQIVTGNMIFDGEPFYPQSITYRDGPLLIREFRDEMGRVIHRETSRV